MPNNSLLQFECFAVKRYSLVHLKSLFNAYCIQCRLQWWEMCKENKKLTMTAHSKKYAVNDLAAHSNKVRSKWFLPNGHIFVDSPSIRRQNSTWKVRENDIDFERRIHVEVMTSIRLGYFDVDSTFKIDEISMSSPRGFFFVVSTSNRRNFCTRCFHCLTFSALGTYSKLFWYDAESL